MEREGSRELGRARGASGTWECEQEEKSLVKGRDEGPMSQAAWVVSRDSKQVWDHPEVRTWEVGVRGPGTDVK